MKHSPSGRTRWARFSGKPAQFTFARCEADTRAVAGYLISALAFALPLAFGAIGIGRPRLFIGLGAALACIWAVALVAGRAQDGQGHHVVPIWFLLGLAALLYVLWCGGLWLGTRLKKARAN
jgi:hypothetical protein